MRQVPIVLSFLGLTASCCTTHHVFAGRAERTERIPLTAHRFEAIALATDFGSIEVSASADAEPVLVAKLALQARDDAEAERLLADVTVEVATSDATVTASLRGSPVVVDIDGDRVTLGATVSYTAIVPPGTRVSARSESGSIKVAGPLASCTLESGFGGLDARHCEGEVRLHTDSGSIVAEHVRGDLRAESGFGAITLRDVDAPRVHAETASGSIAVARCAAERIVLSSGFGGIEVDEVRGALDVRTDSGSLKVDDFEGDLLGRSGFGAIDVRGGFAALDVSSDSGAVEVEYAGDAAKARAAPWRISSGFGAITLSLPEGISGQLDASTGFGRVDSDFEVAAADAVAKRDPQRLTGRIGDGGPAITVHSDSGSVQVQRRD